MIETIGICACIVGVALCIGSVAISHGNIGSRTRRVVTMTAFAGVFISFIGSWTVVVAVVPRMMQ